MRPPPVRSPPARVTRRPGCSTEAEGGGGGCVDDAGDGQVLVALEGLDGGLGGGAEVAVDAVLDADADAVEGVLEGRHGLAVGALGEADDVDVDGREADAAAGAPADATAVPLTASPDASSTAAPVRRIRARRERAFGGLVIGKGLLGCAQEVSAHISEPASPDGVAAASRRPAMAACGDISPGQGIAVGNSAAVGLASPKPDITMIMGVEGHRGGQAVGAVGAPIDSPAPGSHRIRPVRPGAPDLHGLRTAPPRPAGSSLPAGTERGRRDRAHPTRIVRIAVRSGRR